MGNNKQYTFEVFTREILGHNTIDIAWEIYYTKNDGINNQYLLCNGTSSSFDWVLRDINDDYVKVKIKELLHFEMDEILLINVNNHKTLATDIKFGSFYRHKNTSLKIRVISLIEDLTMPNTQRLLISHKDQYYTLEIRELTINYIICLIE